MTDTVRQQDRHTTGWFGFIGRHAPATSGRSVEAHDTEARPVRVYFSAGRPRYLIAEHGDVRFG